MLAVLCAALLLTSDLVIDGPPDFVAQVEAGLAALQTIGLDGFVTTHINRVSAGLPPAVAAADGRQAAAWTETPSNSYARTAVRLRYPYALWDHPVEVAAYLVHEATHVYRYRIDPLTWTDEAVPSATELLVRWSLDSRR